MHRPSSHEHLSSSIRQTMTMSSDEDAFDEIDFKCTQIVTEEHKQPIYAISICEQSIPNEDCRNFFFASCAKNQISVYKHQYVDGNDSTRLIQSYVDADSEEYFYDCKWTMFGDTTILASAGLRGVVRILDVAKQRYLKSLQHLSSVNQIAFARDRPNLMASCCSNYTVMFWDAEAALCLANFCGPDFHKQAVLSVDIFCDGSWIVSGGSDNYVCVWSTDEEAILKNILTAQRGPIFREFRLASPHRVHLPVFHSDALHDHYVDSVKILSTNLIISKSADHNYCIWKFGQHRTNAEILFRWQRSETSAIIFDVRFGVSISRKLFAIGRLDGSIAIWNITELPQGASLLTHQDSKSMIRNIAFTSNGQKLIACSENGQIFVWTNSVS